MEGEKVEFKCEKCGKAFRDITNLNQHKNRKSPCVVENLSPEDLINPNRCPHCNKIFTNIGNKNKHMKLCKIKVDVNEQNIHLDYDKEIKNLKLRLDQKDEQIMKLLENMQVIEKIITKIPNYSNKNGYIYFIIEIPFANRVKLGISNNPAKRLKQLQTGNPNRLVIYHMFESTDYKLLERTLHNICADKKIINEWFEMDESELQSLISGL
ncbi:Bacteriophage T5 orf 172 domain-containing with Zinc finger domain [Pacmanvirus A23]|uniref:Bacteriophage T5 orf 172 domain-containing with Zinc finger domain n=1 Tax=Pacmanvirus A23 TaxID=1932881 RepID=UPI000A092F29|nr:Bacteriophage T5 orf 172 domain-containing with Zinc finger domain [Pacmanvirus A23]SIP85898.1 Bacteriophage T5 orf 172 domain-containing with Zinc finger domain [Pacmanvirus A23]